MSPLKYCLSLLCFVVLVANTTTAQKKGDFKLRYGVDFRDRPRRSDLGVASQRGKLVFAVNLSSKFNVGFDATTFQTKRPPTGSRVIGYGNTLLNFGYTPIRQVEGQQHPGLAVTYSLKLPTASVSKGLGSGRVDHELLLLVTKDLSHRTSVEADFGVYLAGVPQARNYTTQGELVLAFERVIGDLEKSRHILHSEVDLNSRVKGSASEIYSLHWMNFVLSEHIIVRTTLRVGVTVNSPRYGFVASIIYKGSFK